MKFMNHIRSQSSDDCVEKINEINYSECLHQHHQNARARVKHTGLLFDAIQLAQNKKTNVFTWQASQAEHHPALLTLCAFWECYQAHSSLHEARIPYIQCFLGEEVYEPILEGGPLLPVVIKAPKLQQKIKAASVIFGEVFLVTYLAGRHITTRQSNPQALIYYTVNNQPILKEERQCPQENSGVFDHPNPLAFRTLQALKDFPDRFPTLWQQLKKQHEERSYALH